MNFEDRRLIIELYEIYNSLLTDKQKYYLESVYFYDLSLGEIALDVGISRNAVFDQVHKAITKLVSYEEKLKLKQKNEKILSLVENTEFYEKILDIIKE